MLERVEPSATANKSLLGMCSKLNLLETAVEILTLAVEHRSRVSSGKVVQLRDLAAKKRKTACVEAIEVAMSTLGIQSVGA